jgi:hypothetical protein
MAGKCSSSPRLSAGGLPAGPASLLLAAVRQAGSPAASLRRSNAVQMQLGSRAAHR